MNGGGTPSSTLLSPADTSTGDVAPLPTYASLDTSNVSGPAEAKAGAELLNQLEAFQNENRRRLDNVAEPQLARDVPSHVDPIVTSGPAATHQPSAASLGRASPTRASPISHSTVSKSSDLQAMRERARQQRLAALNGEGGTGSPASVLVSPNCTTLSDPTHPLTDSTKSKPNVWSPNTSFALPNTSPQPEPSAFANDSFTRSSSTASPAIAGEVFAELEALKNANRARIATRAGLEVGSEATGINTPPPGLSTTVGPTATSHNSAPTDEGKSANISAPNNRGDKAEDYPLLQGPTLGVSHHHSQSVAVSAAERVKAALAMAAHARTGSPVPIRNQRGVSLPPQTNDLPHSSSSTSPVPSAMPASRSFDQLGSHIGSLSTDSLLAQSSSVNTHDEAATPFLPPHTARGEGHGLRLPADSKESSYLSTCLLPPAVLSQDKDRRISIGYDLPPPGSHIARAAPRTGGYAKAPPVVMARPRAVRLEAVPNVSSSAVKSVAYARSQTAPSSPDKEEQRRRTSIDEPEPDSAKEDSKPSVPFQSIADPDDTSLNSSNAGGYGRILSTPQNPGAMSSTSEASKQGSKSVPGSTNNLKKVAATTGAARKMLPSASAQQRPPSSTSNAPAGMQKKQVSTPLGPPRNASSPMRSVAQGATDAEGRAASPTGAPRKTGPTSKTLVSPLSATGLTAPTIPGSPLNLNGSASGGSQPAIFLMSPAARRTAAAQANATLAGAGAHTLLQSLGRSNCSSSSFDSTTRSNKEDPSVACGTRGGAAPSGPNKGPAQGVQRSNTAAVSSKVTAQSRPSPIVIPKAQAMGGTNGQRMASPLRSATKSSVGSKAAMQAVKGPTGGTNIRSGEGPAPRVIPITTTTHSPYSPKAADTEAEDLFLLADDDETAYYSSNIHNVDEAQEAIPHSTSPANVPAASDDKAVTLQEEGQTTEVDRPPSPIEVVKQNTSIMNQDEEPKNNTATASGHLPDKAAVMAEVEMAEVVEKGEDSRLGMPNVQELTEVEVPHEVAALEGTYGLLLQSWGTDPNTDGEVSNSAMGAKETDAPASPEGSPLPHRPASQSNYPTGHTSQTTLPKPSVTANITQKPSETQVITKPPATPVQPTISGPLFCTNCGQKHVQGGKFCGHCGHKRELQPPK